MSCSYVRVNFFFPLPSNWPFTRFLGLILLFHGWLVQGAAPARYPLGGVTKLGVTEREAAR